MRRKLNLILLISLLITLSLYTFVQNKIGHAALERGLFSNETPPTQITKQKTNIEPKVAIGLAITSKFRKTNGLNMKNIKDNILFFSQLLPSFCPTASRGFTYHFFLAFDKHDVFFTGNHSSSVIKDAFYDIARDCDLEMTLTFVHCAHKGSPAWAQNDAMMEAYLDNCDYFYRVNDDTRFITANWTHLFINRLKTFTPPNIGVVGPTSSDRLLILTYEFVHHTHIDIMGFYYPRIFSTWWADLWISFVYKPNRYRKLSEVKLVHTRSFGTRYAPTKSRQFIKPEKEKAQRIIERYDVSIASI